jgi:hypothetical protein
MLRNDCSVQIQERVRTWPIYTSAGQLRCHDFRFLADDAVVARLNHVACLVRIRA